VRDWQATGGLDILLDLARTGGGALGPQIVRAVLEAREAIGIDAARRAAGRGSLERREAIAESAAACARTLGEDGAPAYEARRTAIVETSGNLARRLSLNTLLSAVGTVPAVAEQLWPSDAEGITALGTAIGAGDVAGAEAAARRLLEPAAVWASAHSKA
jgi:DNA-binding FadR family transcriptional regulator